MTIPHHDDGTADRGTPPAVNTRHPDDLLTVAEAATYLRMHVETLRRYIRAGLLTPGGARLFRRRKLDEFVDHGDPIPPPAEWRRKRGGRQ